MNDKNYDTLVRIIEDLTAIRDDATELGQHLFYYDDSTKEQLDGIELALDHIDMANTQLNIIRKGELK